MGPKVGCRVMVLGLEGALQLAAEGAQDCTADVIACRPEQIRAASVMQPCLFGRHVCV